MSDKKYTDEEIVKALECCGKDGPLLAECEKCPLNGNCCATIMPTLALSLINRQKAEIERLQRLGAAATRKMVNARAEAINEFSERLKEYLDDFYSTDEDALFDTVSAIDEIAKELTEGKQ